MMIKKMMAVMLAVVACWAFAADDALANARTQIEQIIEQPQSMTSVIKGLSAADQLKFVAEVNAAISKMPGSIDEKTAKSLNVNRAALKGAAKGNVSQLIAEVFATVPVESLTIIGEQFAKEFLDRTADSSKSYTDAQFVQIATGVMKTINERVAETDNPSARSVLAVLMFEDASHGTPENLENVLLETIPNEEARELAKNDWLPAARDKENPQRFESLLSATNAKLRPDLEFVLVIAGPQHLDSVMADMAGRNLLSDSLMNIRTPVVDAVENPLVYQIPHIGGDLKETANPESAIGGDAPHDVQPGQKPSPEDWKDIEPGPYQWESV